MSYGIVRVQKMTRGSVKGIQIHDLREKEGISHTNKDIDWERTNQNYDLHNQQNHNFNKAVKERIEKLDLKKAVRKDAIVLAQCLVTSDHNFFECKTYNETKQFFQDSYNFLSERYGAENVVSATVHMDEHTPHMHFNFVPITTDGRLSAKSILNRVDLIKQHDDFYKEVGKKYYLARGERNSNKKHLETIDYKKKTVKELEREIKNHTATLSQIQQIPKIEPEKTIMGKNKPIKLDYYNYNKLIKSAEQIPILKANIRQLNEQIKNKDIEISKISNSNLLKDNKIKKFNDERKEYIKIAKTFLTIQSVFDYNKDLWGPYHESKNEMLKEKQKEKEIANNRNNSYENEIEMDD